VSMHGPMEPGEGAPSRIKASPKEKHCTINGCDKPIKAKGRCQSHYTHWWQFERPGGRRCQVPAEIDGTPCNRPAIGNNLCIRHYQRQRLYGRLNRKRPKFDHAAQQAVLAGMRQGMTMTDAARAAGWDAASVKAMLVKTRNGEYPSLRRFAEEADVILRARRKANLSPAGLELLEALELETARSLRRDQTRWAWKAQHRHGDDRRPIVLNV
jgi:hypothetical protein